LDIDGARASFDASRVALHEMLVAIAVCGVVIATTYATLEQGLRTHAVGAARVETQQAARSALERLAQEIRYAGRGTRWTGAVIVVAEPSRLVLANDLNDDGTTTARGEQITWQLVGSVLRRNSGSGAGAQPVINGVRAFELRYFDVDGAPTTDVAAVCTVEIALTTEPAGPPSSLAQGVVTQVSTRVRLRNR
jgi:type II secretory pathway component PulJ